MEIEGFNITTEEVRVSYAVDKPAMAKRWKGRYEGRADGAGGAILLDVTKDEGAEEEFLAREFVNRVQKVRKNVSCQRTLSNDSNVNPCTVLVN